MNRTLRFLVAGMALCLAVGCGGSPTDLNICNANCDNEKKCGRASDSDLANCHKGCNDLAGLHMQADLNLSMNCTNAGQIRQGELDCLGNTDACTQIALAACQATSLSSCIKR